MEVRKISTQSFKEKTRYFIWRNGREFLVTLLLIINPLFVIRWFSFSKAYRLIVRKNLSSFSAFIRLINILSRVLSINKVSIKKLNACFYLISTIKGKFIMPSINDLEIFHHIYISKDYEKLIRLLRGDIVLDLGAHVGFFTVRCIKNKKARYVIAVEPHPKNVLALYFNILLNNIQEKCKIVKVAVGEYDGVGKLYLHDFSYLHSMKFAEGSKGSIDVKVMSVDSLICFLELLHVDFIKVDVEGMELEVLRGSKHTIEKFKPNLIIEVGKNNLREVLAILKPFGYKFRLLPYLPDGIFHMTAFVKDVVKES